MRIGLPRETKPGERRVVLDPAGVGALVADRHEVRVERGAGEAVGHRDADYAAVGAAPVATTQAWDVDLVVKVKEIQPVEVERVRRGSALFAFQHLVGDPDMARALAARSVTAIAFEMIRDATGEFPLLAPMSVIAGRMAVLAGAWALTQPALGNGTLLAGVPGAPSGKVLVLGAGHAGMNAAEVALSLGAEVTLLTRSEASRSHAALCLGRGPGRGSFRADLSTPENIARHALEADLVVGAVFVPGTPTPKLLPRSLVARMRRGAVIVDVSIDAGGVAETSRPTTHDDPFFVEEGVVHYCVGNMPAGAARAAAAALGTAALPFVRTIAREGLEGAVRRDPALRGAVLLWKGRATHAGIASEARLDFKPLDERMAAT